MVIDGSNSGLPEQDSQNNIYADLLDAGISVSPVSEEYRLSHINGGEFVDDTLKCEPIQLSVAEDVPLLIGRVRIVPGADFANATLIANLVSAGQPIVGITRLTEHLSPAKIHALYAADVCVIDIDEVYPQTLSRYPQFLDDLQKLAQKYHVVVQFRGANIDPVERTKLLMAKTQSARSTIFKDNTGPFNERFHRFSDDTMNEIGPIIDTASGPSPLSQILYEYLAEESGLESRDIIDFSGLSPDTTLGSMFVIPRKSQDTLAS